MKIACALLQITSGLLCAHGASAQSISNPPRPAALPGQSGFVLIASSMNNFHPGIGTGPVAAKSYANLFPLVPPSLSIPRSRAAAYQSPPSLAVPPRIQPSGLPPEPTLPR